VKKMFRSPAMGVPIEVHYSAQNEFALYFRSETGEFINNFCDGITTQLSKGNKVKVVVWIENNGDYSSLPIELISHESFHVVCKLRRIMYGVDEKSLIVGEQSEEDWAYAYGTIVAKICKIIQDYQIKASKENHVSNEISATTETQ